MAKEFVSKKEKEKRKKKQKTMLIVFIILFVVAVGLAVFGITIMLKGNSDSTGSAGLFHKHTPGPEATCTEPQVCETCGEILEEATGHTPGPEATCTEPQTCTVCGEVLAEAKGHTPSSSIACQSGQVCTVCGEELEAQSNHVVDENGVCTLCGEQILPEGYTIHQAGAGDAESDDTSSIIPETESGHYNMADSGYYSSSVMICGDYGLEYFDPSSGGCQSWASVINGFAEKYPDLHVTAMIVPKCTAYHTPSNYNDPHDDIASYISDTYALLDSSITTPDAMGVMDEHADEYMFYRTDHHWTSLGAYYASVAYCNANGITPYELADYDTTIQTDFTGTLYNYSGKVAALKTNPDYTVFHYPHVAYTMKYYSGGWANGYAFKTDTASYASAFIMGDMPVEVYNTEVSNGKTLMIFKESYGNTYSPYMLDYYSQVIVVDIRDTDLSVSDLIDEYNVTDVLFLNNCQAVSSLSGDIQTRCMD